MTGGTFTASDAARIGQPLLIVRGGRSDEAPFTPQTERALAAMVRPAETTTLPGVAQLMPLQYPPAVARLVAGFVAVRGADARGSR